jgi:tetratricopeptide (TPR) repeat protein
VVIGLLAGGGLLRWKPWRGADVPARIPSVVALPTKVFGGLESGFLTDAIPDTLSTLLASVEGLDTRVPPSNVQVDKLQGDVTRVAEAYGVEFLVLTTVEAEGDRLHLSVKLAEGATQKVRWAAQFQGTRSTYTTLLQEAAQGLVKALNPPGRAMGAVGKPVFSSEVELALREGKYLQRRYSTSKDSRDFEQALAAYREAQSLEPSSALLAAEIASLFQWQHHLTRDAKAQQESERWVARALELDPRCGRAWGVMSWIESNRPNPDPARVVDFALKAAHFAPNDAQTYIVLGSISPTMGFMTANGFRAMELDPLDPVGYSWAALSLAAMGRSLEAIPIIERANRLDTTPGFHRWVRYYCLFRAERFNAAQRAYAEADWPGASRLIGFIMAGDATGGRELARSIVAEWRKANSGAFDWANRATIFGPPMVSLGLNEDVLWVLDKSTVTELPVSYDFLLVDPEIQKLRGDPRYTEALAASRNYALLFLKHADEAKARGEFPGQLEKALTELRELVSTNS